MKYRDEECMPKDINTSDDNEIFVHIKSVLNHQCEKLFKIRPDLLQKMIKIEQENPGVEFLLIYKYGADEASGFKVFNYQPKKTQNPAEPEPVPPPSKKPKHQETTKSLFSSQCAIIKLNAKYPDGKVETVFENEHANSIFGHQPLRHAYQKEDTSMYCTFFLILEHCVTMCLMIMISHCKFSTFQI